MWKILTSLGSSSSEGLVYCCRTKELATRQYWTRTFRLRGRMQRNKHSIAAIDRAANWGLPAWQAQKGDGERGGMPYESPPKFMVCISNCSFKFSTLTLEFYSWIQYFTLFLWNSHHWKTFLHSSFSFWTQLFYLTLFTVHFQLDK